MILIAREEFISIECVMAFHRLMISSDDVSDVKIPIDSVSGILKNHPRFNDNYEYLVWPVIYSLLHNNDAVFLGMNFRERCAIRVIQAQVMRAVTRIKQHYE